MLINVSLSLAKAACNLSVSAPFMQSLVNCVSQVNGIALELPKKVLKQINTISPYFLNLLSDL